MTIPGVVARELALALKQADVRWSPASGDRFSLLLPTFEGDVFTVAEMTIETQGPAGSPVLGFNGTTEWALDEVGFDEALWLPREDQLRDMLGPYFVRLERSTGHGVGPDAPIAERLPPEDRYVVTVRLPSRPEEMVTADRAVDAYALAVLARITAAEAAAGG